MIRICEGRCGAQRDQGSNCDLSGLRRPRSPRFLGPRRSTGEREGSALHPSSEPIRSLRSSLPCTLKESADGHPRASLIQNCLFHSSATHFMSTTVGVSEDREDTRQKRLATVGAPIVTTAKRADQNRRGWVTMFGKPPLCLSSHAIRVRSFLY